MKKNILVAAVGVLMAFFYQTAQAGAAGPVLKEARANVTAVFSRIDSALTKAVGEVSADPAKTLGGLCSSLPAASCSFVDDKGKITATFPEEYKNIVGSDVSKQAHVAKILKTHKPVMGEVFASLQGFDAVAIYRPVFSGKKFTGAVGILVKPDAMLSGALASLEGKDGFHFWVMDKAGLQLYDPDKTQVGKNLLTHEMFTGHETVQALIKRVAAHSTGEGEYKYYKLGTKDMATKLTRWDTVGLYGTQWRLAVVELK